jgi:hypothetical protein
MSSDLRRDPGPYEHLVYWRLAEALGVEESTFSPRLETVAGWA